MLCVGFISWLCQDWGFHGAVEHWGEGFIYPMSRSSRIWLSVVVALGIPQDTEQRDIQSRISILSYIISYAPLKFS